MLGSLSYTCYLSYQTFDFEHFKNVLMVNLKVFLLLPTGHPPPPKPTATPFFELFCHVLKIIELPPCIPNKSLFLSPELNKNRRKLFEPPNTRTSFLEGGASGRLPRQYHSDIASVSGRW